MIGDQCVKVDGALRVLFGGEYAVKKLFCSVSAKLGLQCVSNIFIRHPLAIIKGDNIPDTRWRSWTSYGRHEK